jgi:hypothetical protein
MASGGQRRFAVTLHTGEIEALAGSLPARTREALVAAQHDLEWVFEFGADNFATRLVELARAVQSIGDEVDSLGVDSGASWLAVPDLSWAETAIAQIEDCRPPAHALARDTLGKSFVRWLAHRILPYPTFLLNDEHAANLLGIQMSSLFALAESDVLRDRAALYSGPLDGFLGRRWWRAALQQLLVDAECNQWDPPELKAEALAELTGVQLDGLTSDQPVVIYSPQGYVLDIDAPAETSLRIQPDGWPAYADDPWASVVDVTEDSDFRTLVAQIDRRRLEPAE